MRRFASLAVTVVLVMIGLWATYLWLFHGWASDVSDTRSEWHRAWSIRFFVGACAAFVVALAWVIRGRWRRRSRTQTHDTA
jgi:hypothetical protein